MFVQPGQIVESHPAEGVRLNRISAYPNHAWFRVDCTPQKRVQALAWALQRLGQPYGWGDVAHDWNRPLVGLEVVRRTRLGPVDCSGLVCWAYSKAGVTLTRRPFATPADLSWSVALNQLEDP